MAAAHFVLFINIAIAALFAIAYAAVALTFSSQRKALWFALAYCVGMTKPSADALIPFVPYPAVLEWLGYAGFLAALLLMSPALRLFHGQAAGWRAVVIILLGGLFLRGYIFTWDRTSFVHGVAYQMPFIAAAVLACWSVWHLPKRRGIHNALYILYLLLVAQFVAKPWIAVTVGAGQTLADYVSSQYALISQAATGITLVAIGLTLLLIVVRHAVTASIELADLDPLSGLLNRRGFNSRGRALMARCDVVGMLIDLDHFKFVNDHHGHAVGDQVIVHFASLMRKFAPPDALLARLGGEEFAVLFSGSIASGIDLANEIRVAASAGACDLPVVTASIGVAEMRAGGALDYLIRLADDASYTAKREGRDRVAVAPLVAFAA